MGHDPQSEYFPPIPCSYEDGTKGTGHAGQGSHSPNTSF